LITYGSYISKKENIGNSAGMVVFTDTMVAFLAGLMIFPLVFSQGQTPTQGPGLVFVALPGIFAQMGLITGKIVGGAFFLLLCFAALTSTISLLEIPTTYLVDEKKWPRLRVVILSATVIFLVSLPSMLSHGAIDFFTRFLHYEGVDKSFFDLVFDVFSDVGLPLGGFLMMIFINKKWGMKSFDEEMTQGNSNFVTGILKTFLHFMIIWVNPVLLGIMVVVTVLQKFFGIIIF
jgi:NSS family neurotransmitter:Na+ symporter